MARSAARLRRPPAGRAACDGHGDAGDRIAGRVRATELRRWFVWLSVAVAAHSPARSLLAL